MSWLGRRHWPDALLALGKLCVLTLVPLGLPSCTEEGPDADDIGRDAGINERVVRRLEYTVSVPSDQFVTPAFTDGTDNRANRLTCVDSDENSTRDVFCPVSFDQRDGAAVNEANDRIVEGLFDAAQHIKRTGTTVSVVRELRGVNNPTGIAFSSDTVGRIPAGMRMMLGTPQYGIVINNREFAQRSAAGRSVDFLKQRFAEVVAHEFGHLGGVTQHRAQDLCGDFDLYMCPSINLSEDAPALQQHIINETYCRNLQQASFEDVAGLRAHTNDLSVEDCYIE